MRVGTSIAVLIGLCASVEAGNLMTCPDCGGRVSKRALMCPSCGCRGEVIEKAAREPERKPTVKEPDKFLRADFGNRLEIVRPVIMDGNRYAGTQGLKCIALNNEYQSVRFEMSPTRV